MHKSKYNKISYVRLPSILVDLITYHHFNTTPVPWIFSLSLSLLNSLTLSGQMAVRPSMMMHYTACHI